MQSVCSTQNTGIKDSKGSNIYNSLGFCSDKCRSNFAFAIVKGQDCWCSDTAPGNTKDVASCGDKCPGYPFELCGSGSSNLYGYIQLDKKPAGTANGGSDSSSAKKSTPPPAPKTTSEIVDLTITQQDSAPTTAVESPGTPVTSVQVITQGGSVVTQTVTSVPTLDPQRTQAKPKGASTVGVAVGSAVGVVALLLGTVFGCLWFRKRRRASFDHDTAGSGMHRNTSVLSRTGLLGTRSSVNGAAYYDSHSPVSERRNSQPLRHDGRLNPNAFMAHDDGSRTSVLSVQDNRDYGRVLAIRNPD